MKATEGARKRSLGYDENDAAWKNAISGKQRSEKGAVRSPVGTTTMANEARNGVRMRGLLAKFIDRRFSPMR